MKIKDLPLSERPRERLLKYGVENLSNEELLSIILKSGSKNKSVKELSIEILNMVDNITNLKDLTKEKLETLPGMGLAKSLTILAVIELGKRIYVEKNKKLKITLKNPTQIFEYIKYELLDKNQEYFYCLYLNTKKEVIEKKLLFIGTVNQSLVHPREVFKYAYLYSASAIICIHNHPSGDINPSMEDIRITTTLIELGKINGIPIVDHLIIGCEKYYSFYENNSRIFL